MFQSFPLPIFFPKILNLGLKISVLGEFRGGNKILSTDNICRKFAAALGLPNFLIHDAAEHKHATHEAGRANCSWGVLDDVSSYGPGNDRVSCRRGTAKPDGRQYPRRAWLRDRRASYGVG